MGDRSMEIANESVRRVFQESDEVWRTVAVSRVDGTDTMPVRSDEFRIVLLDGRRLGLDDYRAEAPPRVDRHGETSTVTIDYALGAGAGPDAPLRVSVSYAASGHEPYLRKSIDLTMRAGQAVDRLEVERFRTPLVCDLGGIGEPIFMGDSWFAGLEYPGSHTQHTDGLVTLAHYPGSAKDDDQGRASIRSKSAVLGTGLPGDPIDVAFHDYVESIRLPAPKHLLINTWSSSFRNPGSPDRLVVFFDRHDRKLRPCGVEIDSLQPDLIGWEAETLSRPRQDILPHGYRPLSEALKSRGSSLSLWLSLTGTGNLFDGFPGHHATAEWANEQGLRRTDGPFQDFGGHFCVSVAAYRAAMRETLEATIEDGDISYFKHDFVQVTCSAEGHGHLPNRRHGFEQNLDALLEFFTWERQLKPDILCAPTSYVWQSPWWLMHANYIYWGASDSGAVPSWPQATHAEWGMNYHDGHLFKVYRKWRHTTPVSGMNTQAFLRHPAPGLDPLREWTDYAMMACGRGLRLMDLYFEPDLPDEYWRALGASLNWWQENLEVMGTTRMVGGNPHAGEAHGYAHWQGGHGLLCLRNPDVAEQAIRVPFDKSVLYRGPSGRRFRGRVIYPFVEPMATSFVSGSPILLSIPGYSVMVIELEEGEASAAPPAGPAGLIEGSGSAVADSPDWTASPGFYEDPSMALTARVSVNLPDEAMARCDLLLITRGNGPLPEFPSVTVNGEQLEVPVLTGSGDTPGSTLSIRDTDAVNWSLRRIDLAVFAGRAVEAVATSAWNAAPFMLDAWLVADRPVETPAVTQENLPPTVWHHYRRQTVRLLAYRLSMTPLHH